MRVVFLQNDLFVRVGLTTLAGVLRARGHEVSLILEPLERDPLGRLEELRPGLIGAYLTTTMIPWFLGRAGEIRERLGVPVVAGGPHPTFRPDLAREAGVDFVCRGEGEGALVELVEILEAGGDPGGIQNLARMEAGTLRVNPLRPYLPDLDALPDPDFSLYARYPLVRAFYRDNYPILAGRGCPYDCVFCYVPQYRASYQGKGKYLRWRSPERVLAEMTEAKRRWGVRKFLFEDDTFILYPKWLRAFGELYARRFRMPFACQTTAASLEPETVELLRAMGCTNVFFGVESGVERLRTEVLRKEVSNDEIRRAARLLRRAGIRFQTFNMFGLPGETVEDALATYRMNLELGTSYASSAILTAYPGTSVAPLLGQGHPLSYADSNHLPSGAAPPTEILNLQRLMQFFLRWRAPVWLVRRVIRLRADRLFHRLYRWTYAWSVWREAGISLGTFLRMSLAMRQYLRVAPNPSGGDAASLPVPAPAPDRSAA